MKRTQLASLALVVAMTVAAAISLGQKSEENRHPLDALVGAPLGMMKTELGLTNVQAERIAQIKSNFKSEFVAARKARMSQGAEGERRGGEGEGSVFRAISEKAVEQIKAVLTPKQLTAAGELGAHVEYLSFVGIPLNAYDRLGITAQQEAQLIEIGVQAGKAIRAEGKSEQSGRTIHEQAVATARQVLTPQQIKLIREIQEERPREGG